MEQGAKAIRNVCPRNCYGTCSMLSYVQDGKLIKVTGDPVSSYTAGRLCAKGYAYTQYVNSPERLRYPLRQYPRGSGNWQRISWDSALEQIAGKIIELYDRYGSNLASAYNKFSGNVGLLHSAIEGMFGGIGPHTRPNGDPCLAAGWDALIYDFGSISHFPDPETMDQAKTIVLWGANPAWTAVHQLKFINRARDKGARLVVIDPLFTATAAQADIYLQIKPGTDGMLALAAAKLLQKKNRVNPKLEQQNGWKSFISYVDQDVSLADASAITGVSEKGIEELANAYLTEGCVTWIGYGMQRHGNGGQNVRAINALAALSGSLDYPEGGLFYFHPWMNFFPQNLARVFPANSGEKVSRAININYFAREALQLNNPPVKFLYIACRNSLTQDQNIKDWQELLSHLELVVTTDLFMTKTAEQSDIVLPAASLFEDYDLNPSYWHRWLALNQKAIDPWYEAKSDLEIARLLTRELNRQRPGFSVFPDHLSALDWIEKELTPDILKAYGLKEWQELFSGPAKLKNYDQLGRIKHSLNSDNFEFYSQSAKSNSLPAIARFYQPEAGSDYPLRLMTPQSSTQLHSQFNKLSWLRDDQKEVPLLEINGQDARSREIEEGDRVQVCNNWAKFTCRAVISAAVPPGTIVMAQSGEYPVNQFLAQLNTDMGVKAAGSPGVAFYDAFVDVQRI